MTADEMASCCLTPIAERHFASIPESVWLYLESRIACAIRQAMAEEREACAAISDHECFTADPMIPMVGQFKSRKIAEAIRSRGQL